MSVSQTPLGIRQVGDIFSWNHDTRTLKPQGEAELEAKGMGEPGPGSLSHCPQVLWGAPEEPAGDDQHTPPQPGGRCGVTRPQPHFSCFHRVRAGAFLVTESRPTLQPYGLQHARLPVFYCLPEFAQTHGALACSNVLLTYYIGSAWGPPEPRSILLVTNSGQYTLPRWNLRDFINTLQYFLCLPSKDLPLCKPSFSKLYLLIKNLFIFLYLFHNQKGLNESLICRL